jgi:hypothetical protein
MVYYIPEFLKDQQILHDAQFWRVLDGTKLLNEQLSEIGVNKSIELLQQFLEDSNGDFVTVKIFQTKPTFKTEGVKIDKAFEYRVKLKNTHTNQNYISAPVSNSNQSNFSDQLALYERIHQMEIAKIKAEFEYNDTTPSYTERLAEQVIESGFIGQLATVLGSKIFGTVPVVNQVPENSISGLADSEQKFNELKIGEKEKMVLANFLKENPNYLNMILEAAKK